MAGKDGSVLGGSRVGRGGGASLLRQGPPSPRPLAIIAAVAGADASAGRRPRTGARGVGALALLSSVLCLALSAPALLARADAAAEARFHDDLAREHYRAGRFQDALAEFFFEQRLAPNPRVTFNIALCFDQLGRREDAFLFFDEYLRSDDPDEERRRRAREALERLSEVVARVRVDSAPAGAEIYVDQREHGSYGRTPRLLALEPGEHRLVLEREGHRPVELVVTAERGREVRAREELEVITGELRVRSADGDEVTVRGIDGATVEQGNAPLSVRLRPGVYAVEVWREGHEPWREQVQVRPDARAELVAALERLPAPTGALTVSATAAGALVELDAEPAGFAPMVIGEVPVGSHRVRVAHRGLQPWEGDVDIRAEERAWLTVTLAPPPRTERSPWTWAVGGAGAAGLLAAAVLGGFTLDLRARYDAECATADPDNLAGLREQLGAMSAATDALWIGGALALGAAVVLFFVTEQTHHAPSEANLAREPR